MKPAPEDVIHKLLRANKDMEQMVADRIFPDTAPQGTEDGWIAYQRVANNDCTSHSGFDDLTEPVYQLTYWTKDAKRRKLARQVLLGIFRMKRVEVDGTDVVLAVVDDRDLSDDGPPRMYGASVDVSVSL